MSAQPFVLALTGSPLGLRGLVVDCKFTARPIFPDLSLNLTADNSCIFKPAGIVPYRQVGTHAVVRRSGPDSPQPTQTSFSQNLASTCSAQVLINPDFNTSSIEPWQRDEASGFAQFQLQNSAV